MRKKFQVASDLANVQKASADVLSFLGPLSLSEASLFDIRLCLEEALINAMKYGHKLQKDLKVRLEILYNDKEIKIIVEDQGPGFDVRLLNDCTQIENMMKTCGRGVYLIHQLMDQVRYNEKGNSLLMVKKIRIIKQSA